MDIYKTVTDRMIQQMEQGIIPWKKPWVSTSGAFSHTTGKPYSLLNQMLLRHSGEYVTYKQCQQEGGKVKSGEKSQIIVFWKWMMVEDEETKEENEVPFLRYYNVFHISQCEGLTAKYPVNLPQKDIRPDDEAEKIIAAYCNRAGVSVIHEESNSAFYLPMLDQITLPLRKQFVDTAEYYGTAFHELIHSTGHASRLSRLTNTAFFLNEEYSKEELIAEIGAAAIINHIGLETVNSFRNATAYIQNWLKALRNDKRFIVSAAGKAEKAAQLILAE